MFNTNYFISKLNPNSVCKDFEYFDEIDSTNTYLLEKNNFKDGILVLAEFQTKGRGRLNRKWDADKGKNLTFSLGLIPSLKPEELSKINFAVALSVAEAIDSLTNYQTEIKWPNDILLDGKKFVGMLIESQFDGVSVSKFIIGIGINVLQTEFPEEFASRTTSLKKFFNRDFLREDILAAFINTFSDKYKNLTKNFDNIYSDWLSKCKSIGKEISLSQGDEIITGIFKNVEKDGSMVLDINGKLQNFNSGDVTIIKKV